MGFSATDLVGKATGAATAVQDATSVANAILVTVQKVNYDLLEQGDSGKSLLFAYRGEDTIELSADIPDHFTEVNTTQNDDISLRPEKITVRGYVGELSNQLPGPLTYVQAVATQLSALAPYQPALAVQALEAFNTAQQLYSTAAAAATAVEQAFDLATGQDYENVQQKAFRYIYRRYLARSLFTVMTPWTIMKDMAIESVRAVQDEETQQISEFAITFKRMRFASNELATSTVAQGRRAAQAATIVDHGPQNPPYAGPLSPTSLGGIA